MTQPGQWRPWNGGATPFTGTRLVKVRLRCRSRADAEKQQPQQASYWKKWAHDGGPGDIIEILEV